MTQGIVNRLTYGELEPIRTAADAPATGLSWTATATLVDDGTTTATLTMTEIGSTGRYRPSFTPSAVGVWALEYHATIDGVIAYFGQSVQAVTAAQADPAAALSDAARAAITAVVNQPCYVPFGLFTVGGAPILSVGFSDFDVEPICALIPDSDATIEPDNITEMGFGWYNVGFTLTEVGTWLYTHTYDATNGFGATIQVVTASQADPVAYLAGASVEVVAPLSADATTLRLIQGDSYAAAQSRQLSWSLTGQPDLTTATVTLTIIAGETVTKTATVASPASGSPTITATLTKVETATLSPAKVGVYDLSAAIGSDELTLARGRVYVEGDVG